MENRPYQKKRKLSNLGMAGWILSLIQLALSALVIFLLYKLNVLPDLYLIGLGVGLVIFFLICRALMGRARKKIRFFVGFIIAVFLSVILVFCNVMLMQVNGALNKITEVEHQITSMSVYVLKDDPAQSMSDAADYEFGILKNQGRKDTNNAILQINNEVGVDINVAEYEDVIDLAQALRSGDCDAMILSGSFVEIVSEIEGFESFTEEIRILGTYEWKNIVSKNNSEESEDETFVIYISGIDTTGEASAKSRSDVNILAVVNRETHQVLLLSTPRDYYVPLSISDGMKDKLTHAGIYGVDVSMDTLSMLYDTEIDYYFRVNFTGFQQLIDALGGITIYSDCSFKTGEYYFKEGANDVNGEAALAFARERYSFSGGDRQRGENQMAVISAVIAKMQTSAILKDFSGFMEGVQGSFESDIPSEFLTDLVKEQLAGGDYWRVHTYSVDGSGKTASTYSMSQKSYVMVPDMSTVEEAKEMIRAVHDGEKLK